MSKSKNVKNLIEHILPDNRPVTSLQIVEDHDKCPRNFVPIHRTYDQDSDADLWRETNILFGKRTARYLCLSKSEGLPEYIVETLKVVAEREPPGEGFSLLTRTADSEQKAWRKKQIAYKLSKRGSVTQAVTDVILCAKLRVAPDGFTLAGEVNSIMVCFKTGPVTHRVPPSVPVPRPLSAVDELRSSLHYINISSTAAQTPPQSTVHNDYEIIRSSYKITSPAVRSAPNPPLKHQYSTLGAHSDVEGVPFVLHPNLSSTNPVLELKAHDLIAKVTAAVANLKYEFHLERQILCASNNRK